MNALRAVMVLLTESTAALEEPKAFSKYVLPQNTPVAKLEVKEAFGKLTEREKLYAHFISEASNIGSKVVRKISI